MNSAAPGGATLVIGLGNPLMTDDGVGLAALERLRDDWDTGADVTLVDGGTWGMNLLPLIEDTGRMVLLDAIRTGQPPGTLVTLGRDELPRYFALKLSPHQIDLKEVLALAELRGTLPGEMVALGIEPFDVDTMAASLSEAMEGRIGRLVDAAVAHLRGLGHRVEPRGA